MRRLSIGVVTTGAFTDMESYMSGMDRWMVNFAQVLTERFDVTVYAVTDDKIENGITFRPLDTFNVEQPEHAALIANPFDIRNTLLLCYRVYREAGCKIYGMVLCEPDRFDPIGVCDKLFTLRQELVNAWQFAYPSMPIYIVPNTVDDIDNTGENLLNHIVSGRHQSKHKRSFMVKDISDELANGEDANFYFDIIEGNVSRRAVMSAMRCGGIFLATSEPNTEIDMTMGLEAIANGSLLISSNNLYHCFEHMVSMIEVEEGATEEDTVENFADAVSWAANNPVRVSQIIDSAQDIIKNQKSFNYIRENIIPIIEEDLRDKLEPLIVELGCGWNKQEDRYSIDISPRAKPDKVWDLDKGIPLPDNCAKEVHCYFVIEHLKRPDQLLYEIRRILMDDGKAFIVTDDYRNELSYAGPGHQQHLSPVYFQFFDVTNDKDKKYRLLYGLPPFTIDRLELIDGFIHVELTKAYEKPEDGFDDNWPGIAGIYLERGK